MDRTERQAFRAEVRAKEKVRKALERQEQRERLAYEHGKLDFSRREEIDRPPYRNPALAAQWRRGFQDARLDWEHWRVARVTDESHRAHLRAQLAKVRADCGFAAPINPTDSPNGR